MKVTMLKGKIHRATVEQAELDYVGSITVDMNLLEAAGIYEYEKVQIVDVNNGNRFETYTIAGERGDKIILMAYCELNENEVKDHRPKVVFVDDNNKVERVTSYEKHGRLSDIIL